MSRGEGEDDVDDAKLLGSVLMVAPPEDWIEGPQDWLDDLQPAGVILFKRNLPADLLAVRTGIARLHAWAAARGEALLLAMDEEGGFVSPLGSYIPVPPSARALAWATDPAGVERVFTAHGRRLRALGVTVDFTPVCDVNNNPRNPVIGVRSFGSESMPVTKYAHAVHAGLATAGVASCAKHFPGHGDTDVDSHLALPVVHHDRARFDAIELVPFRALVREVPLVMVAHLACPGLGDGMLPATLAPRIATDLLRRELGFTGVAVTDSMDMQGVSGHYGPEDAAVRAMNAGCDLLLYCFALDLPRAARAGLAAALASGSLSRARLQEASRRVATLRARAAARPPMLSPRASLPELQADAALYRDLCRRAIRVEHAEVWERVASAARAAKQITVRAAQPEVLGRLESRLQARGWAVQCEPEDAAPTGNPTIALLAERRPLPPERVAVLRAAGAAGAALVNVLTPEVDATIADAFGCVVRTADHSDAMLDVLVTQIAGEKV